ncbi:MAG: IS1380 family transposase [Alphaproteobacteria bacterium]
MTECSATRLSFPSCKGRRVEAEFTGGDVSSDGGVLLLRQADRRLGLTAGVAAALGDRRRTASCRHSLVSLLRQRIYGLALGYEDLNDHETLRADPALQTAAERDAPLASPATLCRFENRADRQAAWAIHAVLVEQFIASHRSPPEELILDFDATDDAVHGHQEGRFFHGYYDHYCFLPLYVFAGQRLLAAYLRPSKIDAAKHAWACLALLVKRLRQAWPEVRIIFRADSSFCRWRMLAWCERRGVGYITGIAKNARLDARAAPGMEEAKARFEASGEKHRLFREFAYAADTWDRERRVIARLEHGPKGANPRYIVTNLRGDAQALYERLYCARGDMENRIKEQQLDLFADRTSCHRWWPNQFRLLEASLAYTLIEAIRRLALAGTELARAQVRTIRLKLLKIGAVMLRNTRRVRFLLSSASPYQELFAAAAARLKPG